jgi:hypothetical protein
MHDYFTTKDFNIFACVWSNYENWMKLTYLLCHKPGFMLCKFIYNSSPHRRWGEGSGCLNKTLRLSVYRDEKWLETFLIQHNNQCFKNLPTTLHSKYYSNLACTHKRHCQKKILRMYTTKKLSTKICQSIANRPVISWHFEITVFWNSVM